MTESTEIALWEPEEPETASQTPVLALAQLQLRQTVLDSGTSVHSRRNYAKALGLYSALLPAGLSPCRYSSSVGAQWNLAPSTVHVHPSAGWKMITVAHKNRMFMREEMANLNSKTSGSVPIAGPTG